MPKYKIIVALKLDRPYVNMKPAIQSILTSSRGHQSIRKMEYQPDEKEVFADAGLKLTERLDNRLLQSRTIDCDGIILSKVNDREFKCETPLKNEMAIANREAVDMLDVVSNFMESQGYEIINMVKTKCESDICEVSGEKEKLSTWFSDDTPNDNNCV